MTIPDRQIKCRDNFLGMGYSLGGASALTGNFVRESGVNLPTAFRTGKLDHGSQGLAQWRLARLTNYKAFVASLHRDLEGDKELWPWYGRMDYQCEFVDEELKTDYPLLHAKLCAVGGDAATLAADVCWQYERPSKELSGIADRIAAAKALAVPARPTPTSDVMDATVTDHLHTEADGHDKQADGGIVAAGAAGLGAAALFISNYINSIPRWQVVVIIILLAVMAMCVVAAMASRKKATNVKSAIPKVSVVPKPEDPKPTPAPAPVIPSPGMASVLDDPAVRAAIANAVAADRANRPDPATVKTDTEVVKALPENPVEPVQIGAGGATMSIGGRS